MLLPLNAKDVFEELLLHELGVGEKMSARRIYWGGGQLKLPLNLPDTEAGMLPRSFSTRTHTHPHTRAHTHVHAHTHTRIHTHTQTHSEDREGRMRRGS